MARIEVQVNNVFVSDGEYDHAHLGISQYDKGKIIFGCQLLTPKQAHRLADEIHRLASRAEANHE